MDIRKKPIETIVASCSLCGLTLPIAYGPEIVKQNGSVARMIIVDQCQNLSKHVRPTIGGEE